jgi:xanthine dehydrogenase molybdopterin-binding subunit B
MSVYRHHIVQTTRLPGEVSNFQNSSVSTAAQNAGHSIVCGDVDRAWAQCATVVEGRVRVGGQEHFYLEPQGTVILPGENDEFVIISSTQVRSRSCS